VGERGRGEKHRDEFEKTRCGPNNNKSVKRKTGQIDGKRGPHVSLNGGGRKDQKNKSKILGGGSDQSPENSHKNQLKNCRTRRKAESSALGDGNANKDVSQTENIFTWVLKEQSQGGYRKLSKWDS